MPGSLLTVKQKSVLAVGRDGCFAGCLALLNSPSRQHWSRGFILHTFEMMCFVLLSSNHRSVVVGQQPYFLETTQKDASQCHGSRADYLLLVGWFSLPLTDSLARQYPPFWKNICSDWRGCISHCAWETPSHMLQLSLRLQLLKYPTWFYRDGYRHDHQRLESDSESQEL